MNRYVSDRFVLESWENFPLNVKDGAIAFQSDTKTEWYKISGVWTQVRGGSGSGNNINISSGVSTSFQFRVKEIGPDWLKCQIWSGVEETGNDVYVAKSYELRRTPWDGETVNIFREGWNGSGLITGSTPLTYTYYSNTFRSVNNGDGEEYETVMPAWQTGRTIIFGKQCIQSLNLLDPVSNNIIYVDVNNAARIWASTINFTGLSPVIPVPPILTFTDMPLDQAVYDPITDKIYGVRDQWIRRYASSGTYESSLRWGDVVYDTHITILSGTGYVTSWHGGIENPNDPVYDSNAMCPWRDIHCIDIGSLSYKGKLNLGDYWGLASQTSELFGKGPRAITNDGNRLWGLEGAWALYKVVPTGSGSFVQLDTSNSNNSTFNDVDIDRASGIVFISDPANQYIHAYDTGYGLNGYYNVARTDPAKRPWLGISYDTGKRWLYACDGSSFITRCNINSVTGVPLPYWTSSLRWTGSELAKQNSNLATIKPVHVKWNPYDDLLYVPTWTDDRVVVLRTPDLTVVNTYTGFSSPRDMVFTPTRKFAVQQSTEGLKELTDSMIDYSTGAPWISPQTNMISGYYWTFETGVSDIMTGLTFGSTTPVRTWSGLYGSGINYAQSANTSRQTITPYTVNYREGSGLTISLWYHFTRAFDANDQVTMFTFLSNTCANLMQVKFINSNSGYFELGNNYDDIRVGFLYTYDTGWHHLIMNYSGSLATLYRDNAPFVTTDHGLTMHDSSGCAFKHSQIGNAGGASFGYIFDEVAVFNRSLNNTEMDYLWNGGNGRTWPLGI